MRNPWPMFLVLVLTAAGCVMYDTLFSIETIWRVLVGLMVLGVLGFFAWLCYERWLATRINPYVLAYKQDHDLQKLKQGLDRWRRWAFAGYIKDLVFSNWLSALVEEQEWEAAERELEVYHQQVKTLNGEIGYHLMRMDLAQARGDAVLAEREKQVSEQLRAQLNAKKRDVKLPANARQCRTAFLCWLSFSMALFWGGVVWLYAVPDTMEGAGLCILGVFSLPVTVIWLVVWRLRRRHERKDGSV